MHSLDFFITVLDDRNNLNTFEQNILAHKKLLIDDYSNAARYIPAGNNIYVVIMTVGFRTDAAALRSLINNAYKYIGLLGSKNKIKTLMADLISEGVPSEQLNRVRTPIGVPINSQTPEEIAISIAAEIIGVKNAT
jgi:xanthine dehydrogenase accessory factor